jgi:hypothetical protein
MRLHRAADSWFGPPAELNRFHEAWQFLVP